MNRRDRIYLVAKRGMLLPLSEKASAWNILMDLLDHLSGRQMPKYREVITAIRKAQISARAVHREVKQRKVTAKQAKDAK